MILATPSGAVALGSPAVAALHRIATDQAAGRRPNGAAFHTIALTPLHEAGLVGVGADGLLVLATMTPEAMLHALDLAGYPVLGVNKHAPQFRLVRAADGSGGPLYDTYDWSPLGTMGLPILPSEPYSCTEGDPDVWCPVHGSLGCPP